MTKPKSRPPKPIVMCEVCNVEPRHANHRLCRRCLAKERAALFNVARYRGDTGHLELLRATAQDYRQ